MPEEIYGTCQKCGTENSILHQYKPNYWICRVNCFFEEKERDSGRHKIKQKKLDDYRKICAGSGS